MYPNNQPTQGLPFRTDVITAPFFQINLGQPPFIPQGIAMPPWMQQAFPYLVSLAQDQLVRNAQNGPLSIFFYNMMADANWQSPQFNMLIQDLADYVFVKNANWVPPPHQIDQILANVTVEFMNLRVWGCLIEFPQLWSFIRPEDRQSIEQMVNAWRQLMQAVMHMRGQTPQNFQGGQPVGGGQYYPQQAPQQQQYQQQAPRGHVPFTAQGSAYMNQVSAGPGYGPQVTANSGGRSFGGGQSGQSAPVQYTPQQMAPAQSAGPAPANNNVAQKENTMTMQVTPSTPMAASNLVSAGDVTWRAPNDIPAMAYPPAFNPVKVHLRFEVRADKATIPHIEESGINVIDYDRHAVASLFGKPPAGMAVAKDAHQVTSKLAQGITAIADDAKHATEDMPTVLTKPQLWTGTSLADAWMTAKVDMMALESKRPTVYRMFANLFTPIAGWQDETDQIQRFARSASYIALREELKAAGETASPELVSHVNLMMTEHCNHILHKRLSISPSLMTVEDFTNDLDLVLAELTKHYGDGVTKAFLLDQRREISMMFTTIDPSGTDAEKKLHEMMAGNLLDAEWEGKAKQPQFTFIGRTYNLTLIDVLSHDLQVAGVEGVGNALVDGLQPVLHQLAKNIIMAEVDGEGTQASRHLVRTKDGRIFEITKGHLNQDFLLISLVR